MIDGTLACELDGAGNNDVLAVNGDLDIDGATLAVSTIGAPSGSYTIATYTGARIGSFAISTDLPAGYTVDYSTAGQVRLVAAAASDYATWVAEAGIQDGTPAADPDSDGLSNFQEYAFGLVPSAGSSMTPIVTQLSQMTGLFSYSRRLPSLTSLDYTYEYSTSLSGAWTSFVPAAPVVSNNAAPVELITVAVPGALLTEPRLFIRVVAK